MEHDGVEDALSGQARTFITLAAQVGERLARQRAEALHQAAAQGEHEARLLQDRWEAERLAHRVHYAPVHDARWWETAKPGDVATAYEHARAWAPFDEQAHNAVNKIHQEAAERYNLRIGNVDPTRVGAVLDEAKQAQERADIEYAEEAKVRAGEAGPDAQVGDHLPEAKRNEQKADFLNSIAFDSAERREETAAALREAGIPDEVIEPRMRADVSQGHPATKAVSKVPAKTGATAHRNKAATRTRGRTTPPAVSR